MQLVVKRELAFYLLIKGLEANYVLADKGYDSDAFVSAVAESRAIPVIPSKVNRKAPRAFDKMLY